MKERTINLRSSLFNKMWFSRRSWEPITTQYSDTISSFHRYDHNGTVVPSQRTVTTIASVPLRPLLGTLDGPGRLPGIQEQSPNPLIITPLIITQVKDYRQSHGGIDYIIESFNNILNES